MTGINFLEQLAAEYYEISGSYIIKNKKYGVRPRGGWVGELDVVAIDISKKKILHIECCARKKSKADTKASLERKFSTAREHIHGITPWLDESYQLEQIALIESRESGLKIKIQDAAVVSSEKFIMECILLCRYYAEERMVIPETHPILRTIYFTHLYNNNKTYL